MEAPRNWSDCNRLRREGEVAGGRVGHGNAHYDAYGTEKVEVLVHVGYLFAFVCAYEGH